MSDNTTRNDALDSASVEEKADVRHVHDDHIDPADGAPVEEAYNAAFSTAVKQTNLDGFSTRSLKLYLIVVVGFLNAVSSGFDGSLMGGINVMPQYKNFFGYESTGSSTGIVFMI
jgi:hypothetical protein